MKIRICSTGPFLICILLASGLIFTEKYLPNNEVNYFAIPRIIHITGKAEKKTSITVLSWTNLNPLWTVRWYSDVDVGIYVKDHFPQFKEVMARLGGVSRYDFFRYLVIYREGGLYADADVECLVPIDEWSSKSELNWSKHRFVAGMECNGCNDIGLQVTQYCFLASPGHPILRHTLSQVAANAYKNGSFFERFGKYNRVMHKSVTPLSDGVIGWILTKGYHPMDITPHGTAGDVSILPWWFMGPFAQGDAPPKPLRLAPRNVAFIRHTFEGSWVGRD